MSSEKPLRSLLFVPGNKPRMLEKARAFASDAVILDLEDSVPPGEKANARAVLRGALDTGGFGPQVFVRVNALASGLAEADLEALVAPGLDGICLPKAGTAADIDRTASLLSTLEQERGLRPGGVALLPLIETALGVLNAFEIARTSRRVCALCLGGEDLSRDLGATRTRDGLELAHSRGLLVIAARAAEVIAVDTVFTDLKDSAGLLAGARQACDLGFSGKLLVHPSQIEPVHEAFSPSDDEVAHAYRVLRAFEAAMARGEGVIALDGQMIDAPVVARAREVISVAEATG